MRPVLRREFPHRTPDMTVLRKFLLLGGIWLLGGTGLCGQSTPDYEQAPVSYSETTARDRLARQLGRIASGEIKFAGTDQEVLRTLLQVMEVPEETQIFVFSKTSLQRGRIRPERPRVLYFSDSAYVGWVPGGLMEVTAIDPELGPVFYSFDLGPTREKPPTIIREGDCLRCHGGTFVRDVPGVFVRSIFPDATGEPLLRHGTVVVDDETPFDQRWGGWYVTGYKGSEPHRGNSFASEKGDQLVFTPSGQRPDQLSGFFDTTDYLRPTSDMAALLVAEHQMAMQNSITRAGFVCRKMLTYQRGLQTTFKEPVTEEPAYDSVKSVFASAVQDVVDHLLFRKAAMLPDGIVSNADFKRSFPQGAPRTRAGHSLKDLQLQDRIFVQRCSYLIYAESFQALPEVLKVRIFERLRDALRSTDPQERYAYLPAAERQRIYEILFETQPDARRYWSARPGAVGPARTE